MTARPKSKPSTTPPDMWFVEYLTPHDAYYHGVKTLLYSTRSPYQSITIADTGAYGRALFLDGKIQTAEEDEPLYHEPLVHVPNVFHSSPAQVLILGGADGGAAREALKWKSVQRVVVVDIDQVVVDSCKQFLPSIAQGSLEDPRCDPVVADALEYIRDTKDAFDVIICDLTDPMEDSPSLDLFTLQFFKKLAARLSPTGAISIQVGPASLVESSTLMPRICATLRQVFSSVHPYQVFVPTFGSPLGMAVATKKPTQIPVESTIDAILHKQIQGFLSVIDGFAFRGLFALPKGTRRAIDEEVDVFTDTHTANAFGRGNLLTN
eukprot:GFKZ01003317.1.p1 GENE.GFKZ01003317.1~~GFKZ01003317.1.p1  ORF type:complete len:353 (+),score=43.45 GFKZ01003317.1:96-1061(+)